MTTKTPKKIILYSAFVFSFFPFVSPAPINSDLQPIFFIFAILCLILWLDGFRFGFAPFFLILIVPSLFYFRDYANWSITDFLRFSSAAVAYLFFFNFGKILNQKILLHISFFWFGLLTFNFFYAEIFIFIFEDVMYGMRSQNIGYRGASGLAPEPGFAGLLSVGIFAISAFKKEYHLDKNYFLWIFIFTILSVMLTRSGTGSLYLLIFCLFYFFRLRYTPYLFACFGIFIFAYFNLDLGRGSNSVVSLLLDPFSAVTQDTSIGTRVLNTVVGLFSVIEQPLGFGFDDYAGVAADIVVKYSLSDDINGSIGTSSNFGRYSVYMGMLWWLFLFLFFAIPVLVCGRKIIAFSGLAFIFLSTSVSVSFPVTWALIALTHLEAHKVLCRKLIIK